MERIGDWIQTFSGVQFYPLDPQPEDIEIEDIAHALSMKCRYNGHCKEFYSVAQHCWYVARECERRWPDREDLILWGLLHDAGEAYLPDVPRPIKYMGVGVLFECERKILDVVANKYRLSLPEPKEIKVVDNAILASEAKQIMGKHPSEWHLPEPAIEIIITSWTPELAKERFLAEFNRIINS